MLNRVELIGRLGADPEIKSFQNGGRICNIRLATSERWTDKNTGEKKELTEWHSVVISADGLIDVASKYLRKGSKMFVAGKLRTRKWQGQDGSDRYSTEVLVDAIRGQILLLDSKENGQPGGQASTTRHAPAPTPAPADDLDDEIPF